MRILTLVSACLLLGGHVMAITLKSEPDYRFAFNQFTAVATADSFAVLAGPEGILSAVYNNSTDKFTPAAQLLTSDPPLRVLVDDEFIVVVFRNSRACLLNRSTLPQLVVNGNIILPDTTFDLAFHKGWMYVAAGFRGLLYAPVIDNERLGPLDSSQIGVHLVSLDIQDNRVLATDDYNGLLEYSIQGDGVPRLVSQLNLPFQCADVAQQGDTAILSHRNEDSLFLAVRDSTGWNLEMGRVLPFGCNSVYVMDTFVIVLSRGLTGFTALTRRSLAVINSVTNQSGQSLRFPAQLGAPGSTRLLVPGQNGGLLQYWLDWFDVTFGATEAYSPAGAINSLTFAGNWLVAGGVGGWCHGYACGDSPVPDTEIVVFNHIGVVAKVLATRHGVVILNSVLRKINLTKDDGFGPRPFATYFLGHAASNITWGRKSLNNYTPVFIWSGQDGYLYRFSGVNTLEYVAHLAVPIAMRSATILDSLLVVSVAKSGLQVYCINPDFTIGYRGTVPGLTEVSLLMNILTWPDCVAAVNENQLSRITLTNPRFPKNDTTIDLPLRVQAGFADDTALYLTGPESTALWSLPSNGALPIYRGSTPFGGHSVAGNGKIMAVTNGNAIYTFDLRGPTDVTDPVDLLPKTTSLLVNYPNPFNPNTIIAYDIMSPGEMSLIVYNSLGRQVRVLEQAYRPPGRYMVEWNGRDDDNRSVASGTYFCRLLSRDGARTGKMVLVK